MRVTHCISGLGQGGGGPSRSVPALVRAQERREVQVELLYVRGTDVLRRSCPRNESALRYTPFFPRGLAASRELRIALFNGDTPDIYHGHCLWQLPVHSMCQAARKNGSACLIAPRGMLEPWALGRSRWRKRAAAWLFQDRDLHRADCLHALAPSEVGSFRRYGLRNPIAVVPNAVDLAEFSRLSGAGEAFQDRFPAARDRPLALFLSRLHPKKGLLHLVEAWKWAHPRFPDWLLVIVGPDDVGHRREVEKKVRGLEIQDAVLFTGPLYGEDKLEALAAADFFVLPSFSEGFSMAVLEAMACRLPVLIAPGCNFPEVEAKGAGLVVEPSAKAVEDGLRTLMAMSDAQRRGMGQRGRRMIEERYTWDRVAGQMIQVYEWLLNGGNRPPCVVID
ncbi:MAG: glycosyltransferase [Candidatus Brocadiae bacterium]|nr:glycosyltransferase [Candidatus Brocadiia bacterium]